jgi:hypothetical protein
MALTDDVRELQRQGFPEDQIVQRLREAGNNPAEINQALEQARIKTAVAGPAPATGPAPDVAPGPEPGAVPPTGPAPRMAEEISEGEQMMPSMAAPPEEAPPTTIPMPELPPEQAPAEPTPAAPGTPEYIYPTTTPEYAEYPQYAAPSSESITEIAEQVTSEKTENIKKELNEIKNFRTEAESKLKDFEERLKRIEGIIDTLQTTILGKIGSFGQSIEDINQEMQMMQDSFSKTLPKFAKSASKTTGTKSAGRKSKKSDGFEHYLR